VVDAEMEPVLGPVLGLLCEHTRAYLCSASCFP
jgi:hypothetical protein